MKSIKTNPNSAKGPDKGKIVSKLYCILLTTPVNSFGKAFAHVQNCLLMKKAHGTNRIVELNKTLTELT
jgi:hypothetical protein